MRQLSHLTSYVLSSNRCRHPAVVVFVCDSILEFCESVSFLVYRWFVFFLSSSEEPCGTRSLPTVESEEHNLIVTTEPKTLVGFSFNCLFYLTETWWIWVGFLVM